MAHATTFNPLRYPDAPGVLVTKSGYEKSAEVSWSVQTDFVVSYPENIGDEAAEQINRQFRNLRR